MGTRSTSCSIEETGSETSNARSLPSSPQKGRHRAGAAEEKGAIGDVEHGDILLSAAPVSYFSAGGGGGGGEGGGTAAATPMHLLNASFILRCGWLVVVWWVVVS